MASPLGPITLVAQDKALLFLYTEKEKLPQAALGTCNKKHPILLLAKKQIAEYFSKKRISFDLPLQPFGTSFQTKVWNALLEIPHGEVWSYGQQAKYIKNPNAQRAVGGANGKNPIPIIIPCHRVVGSTGKLTGFSSGMDLKIFLLRHEGHKVDEKNLRLL